jgi:glycosyltransferase involved in cell wall biosynthesis
MTFIIITVSTSWDEIPRARHQITEELLRAGHEVIFVEKNRTGFPGIQSRTEKPGLTVITPLFPLDYRFRYRLPLISEIYQLWLFSHLKKRFGDLVVINFDFTAHLLHRFFKRNVYYCNDEYIGNSNRPAPLVDCYHKFIERRVAKKSRFCVSTTGHLTRKLSADNQRVYEIPLGGPPPQPTGATRCFEKRNPLRIGLMGSIEAGHASVDIINRLLEEPDFKLIFIGVVGEDFRRQVKDIGQIDFKGILTGEALFREMADFDVAIAPYNLEKINAGVTPNKLFQYLACACPVVISDIPNIQGISYPRGTVYVANNGEEFVESIRKAYAEDCPDYARVRLQYAAENTWGKRVTLFMSHLKEYGLLE